MTENTKLPSCLLGPGGNPYARVDLDSEELVQHRPAHREAPMVEQLRLAVSSTVPGKTHRTPQSHASGNPYARLVNEDEGTPADRRGASLAEFEGRCRAIFRPYVPTWIRTGTLPAVYRDFITRNRTRDPIARRRLLTRLGRFDLADMPGIATQFNREDDTKISSKLAEIERLADSDT
jgi:hypothetical protein